MSSSSGEPLQPWPQVHQLLLLLLLVVSKQHLLSCSNYQTARSWLLQVASCTAATACQAVYAQLLQLRFCIFLAPLTEYQQFCTKQGCQAPFLNDCHTCKHCVVHAVHSA